MGRSEKDPSRRNGRPSNGKESERPVEFERFEDLASKLLQVPKKELDEKRKAKR